MKKIEIIGVPSDFGANKRGTCMGPAAIRIAGLKEKIEQLGYEVNDKGDVFVPIRETLTSKDYEHEFLLPIQELNQQLSEYTYESMKNDHLPIVIGGDHSLALGSISGVSRFYHEKNQKIGVIWIDAHADINTPQTSPTQNIHGMPLAVLLGKGYSELTTIQGNFPKIIPNNVVIIGLRSIDGNEKQVLRNSGVHYFTMRDIDEQGIHQIMKKSIEYASYQTAGIHLSFDIDSIDPLHAPGVSTPVYGGLSLRESHLILEMIAESQKLMSMDLVELNPLVDIGGQSANLAIELIQSVLGKSIV